MRNVKNLTLFVLMLALLSTAAVADIHYVNPGESIQSAIITADPGDEIEVAPGTYTGCIDFIGKAIRLYSSGGPEVTIISGGFNPHVVQCVNHEGPDTILEGFTITDGVATGDYPDSHGGGMYNGYESSPTVTNCTFTDNFANGNGGGMYNDDDSSPTVTNCIFSRNTALNGGGMYNCGDLGGSHTAPTVTNCTFNENIAYYNQYAHIGGNGGGMYNDDCGPIVTNCIFNGNTADSNGGGMYNQIDDIPSPNPSPMVTKCNFLNNTAGSDGGGMYNSYAITTVTDCIFTLNTGENGGGMYNDHSSPEVTNCTFTGNIAFEGGGMYNYNHHTSKLTVTNCTFTGNTAIFGSGMYNDDDSKPTITNCILWGDVGDEIYVVSGSPSVTYSDVQGGTGEPWFGEGCTDALPLFADAYGRLSPDSPCIDAGNDAAIPPGITDDLDGNRRIQGARVDMGAFESEFTAPDFSGWVWIESGGDFGYSQDEDDLLYFLSFGPVWYYNTATSLWSEEGPVGWTYVNWPFLYEYTTSTTIFALPPASGLSVYHFRTGEWSVSPQIIPW